MVDSSIYWFKLISLPLENHRVTKRFTRWVDQFTMPAAGENLGNFTCFMTDFNMHSTGISDISNR
jgi:hypothetical protein